VFQQKQEFMIRKKAVQVGPARAFQVKDKSSVRHIIIIVVSPTGDKGAVLELPLSSFRTGAEVAVRKKWRTNVIVCQFSSDRAGVNGSSRFPKNRPLSFSTCSIQMEGSIIK
jgi:hypothetical protein